MEFIYQPPTGKRVLSRMRAKEMAAKFKAEPTVDTLKNLIEVMVFEAKTMIDSRGVKTDSGLLAILKEQNQKYRAFINRVGPPHAATINPDGFKLSMHALIPITKQLPW
jgi:hypothetical protein